MRRRRRKGSDIRLMSFDNVIDGNIRMKTKEDKLGSFKGFFYANRFDEVEIEKNTAFENVEKVKGNWSKIFGNENPIYLEVGTGRGQFVTNSAIKNPNINYIGLELKEEVLLRACEKAIKDDGYIENLRFIWGNVEYLDFYFDDKELSRIYINFCDPWPKKKNAKRRLTSVDFLNLYERKINTPEIHFKTDNRDLFEFSLNEMSSYGWRFKNISLDLANSDFTDNVTTEYEDKFMEANQEIYRLEAFKE